MLRFCASEPTDTTLSRALVVEPLPKTTELLLVIVRVVAKLPELPNTMVFAPVTLVLLPTTKLLLPEIVLLLPIL